MTPITDPAEEYFKDGLWAWDATDKVWVKLPADHDTGILQVIVVASPDPYPLATYQRQDQIIGLLQQLVTLTNQLLEQDG